jgi:hypothetical protein
MPVYATAQQVIEYVGSDNPDVELPDGVDSDGELLPGSELERLIAHAERDVDRELGPIPKLTTGLKLDPAALTEAQRGALARATAAAVEFRASLDAETLVGADDYLSGEVSIIRRAGRPPGPRVREELAGFGLVKRSGCAVPDPA